MPHTSSASPIRARFAPSPTGALHLGNIRTALFAWLAARSTGGQFILRIEDTDQGRLVPGSEATIFETLQWLGLNWDEGPMIDGPYGPYIQSQRTTLYQEYGDQLAADGKAYWCTCTADRLEAMRLEQQRRHLPTRYDRTCLYEQERVASERALGKQAVLRLQMPEGTTSWDDLVRGRITFDNGEIDDSVLLKSDGFPTYHLAVVIDDHLMHITNVIRSEEWIPSTPKHLVLYSALGWEPPIFAHVPHVLGQDKKKLSKRKGAKTVLEYRAEGYLPTAIINAMALLGWSPKNNQEMIDTDEIINRFSLADVHAAPAVFDGQRLEAINAYHVRHLSDDDLAVAVAEWMHIDAAAILPIIPILRERITTFADAPPLIDPLIREMIWHEDTAFPPKNVTRDDAEWLLTACIAELGDVETINAEQFRSKLTAQVIERGLKPRDAFRVLYCALYGQTTGLPVFDAMTYLGGSATRERLQAAKDRLSA